MSRVAVCFASVITALGDLEATFNALMSGKSGLRRDIFSGPLARWPLGVIADLDDDLGSAARLTTLLSTVLDQLPALPDDSALITATTKGAVDELLRKKQGAWQEQPWQLGEQILRKLKLSGPDQVVSAACASGTLALISAAQMINSGEKDVVVVVGIDILSTFVTAGFAGLKALAADRCRPFDKDRNGLALGEGAAALVLANSDTARKNNWPILAYQTDWAASCDADHITAPNREARGLIAAIEKIVQADKNIGAVNAHGTGTRYNDAMEMVALKKIWPQSIPFHSVKGAIGHCLGAAGLIEAAVAIQSLAAGEIPPSVGLVTPEEGMDGISGTCGQALLHPSILTCNSGFGGINAAVLFEEGRDWKLECK